MQNHKMLDPRALDLYNSDSILYKKLTILPNIKKTSLYIYKRNFVQLNEIYH